MVILEKENKRLRNDGNLTQDGRWAYTWNADEVREHKDGAPKACPKGCLHRAPHGRGKQQNRLIAMETLASAVTAGATREKLEFVYDYMGRMFERVVYKNDIAESTERFMGKK